MPKKKLKIKICPNCVKHVEANEYSPSPKTITCKRCMYVGHPIEVNSSDIKKIEFSDWKMWLEPEIKKNESKLVKGVFFIFGFVICLFTYAIINSWIGIVLFIILIVWLFKKI